MRFGIDKFIGLWKSEDGYYLKISKISSTSAIVSFYDPSGEPVIRPYYGSKPTVQMPASYDEYEGEFDIDLWETGKGFTLNLTYLNDYVFDKQKKELLIPSIIRNEDDDFLDKHYKLYGTLKNLVKEPE